MEGVVSRTIAERKRRKTSATDRGPTVLELFAGCGGMLLGFHRAGFRTVLANEFDTAACATLRKNLTDANLTDAVVEGPVEAIRKFPKADVVAGGPALPGIQQSRRTFARRSAATNVAALSASRRASRAAGVCDGERAAAAEVARVRRNSKGRRGDWDFGSSRRC